MKKTLGTILFIAGLCISIYVTDDEIWLSIWFIVLIFVGLPLLLLSLRDMLVSVAPRLRRGPLLLHTCAVFAALLGYGVGWMAVNSDHPKAHLHQWMVVIFPLFVYATPLLMLFHGLPVSQLRHFYFGAKIDDGDA